MNTILFGIQKDWEDNIRSRLDASRYEGTFGNLEDRLDGYDALVPLMLEDYWGLNERPDDVRGRAIFPPDALIHLCHAKSCFNERLLLDWTA